MWNVISNKTEDRKLTFQSCAARPLQVKGASGLSIMLHRSSDHHCLCILSACQRYKGKSFVRENLVTVYKNK